MHILSRREHKYEGKSVLARLKEEVKEVTVRIKDEVGDKTACIIIRLLFGFVSVFVKPSQQILERSVMLSLRWGRSRQESGPCLTEKRRRMNWRWRILRKMKKICKW